jgi:hypothetical protein
MKSRNIRVDRDRKQRRRRSADGLSFSALVLLMIIANCSCAQVPGQNSTPSAADNAAQQSVPIHHLYRFFLRYQQHLDQRANELQLEGHVEEAANMRNHLQEVLHFTDEQIAVVRKAGLQQQEGLKAIKIKVMPTITDDAQWIREHGRKAGPPPGAAQVHEVQQEQEEMLLKTVDQLNQLLGPEVADRLQAYVKAHVSGTVTHVAPQSTGISLAPKWKEQ